MGTAEQKERRRAYADKLEKALGAGSRGEWKNDAELRSYLNSIGGGNPLYNQLYSGGGFSTYGPSWNPGMTSDFENNEEIMNMGLGETWYDPSMPGNWQKTDPLKAARMSGFFNWRDQNMDMINRDFGGNALAAWLTLRGRSDRPNSPDMSWWNEGNKGAPPQPQPAKTGFWNWLYNKPEANLKSLTSGEASPKDFPNVDFGPLSRDKTYGSLGDVEGFDPRAWDKAFNPNVANLATAPTLPLTGDVRSQPIRPPQPAQPVDSGNLRSQPIRPPQPAERIDQRPFPPIGPPQPAQQIYPRRKPPVPRSFSSLGGYR